MRSPPCAKVEGVEQDNRGFDLISRKPHPEDLKTAIEVRFIEVKGRAHTGDIALPTTLPSPFTATPSCAALTSPSKRARISNVDSGRFHPDAG